MAFSFGSSAQSAPTAGQVQNGPDLEDIQTEALGFLNLGGESKLQLLPTPWPLDQLPPPTASLMSVASQQGLLAAAGPDAVILATTESVRKAFEETQAAGLKLKAFQPQLTIPMPMRVSQLAFSADEKYLVLSAENGGGLAVYEVQSLLQGSNASAFELSTNGSALRALIPNPKPERAELFALVTNDGQLMMANLKERNFISGQNGQVLKDAVSCISWSTQGKQLVAGLGNGSAYQMTPEGAGKAEIPKPPNVGNADHVSSITWLENNTFLMVHTPPSYDSSQAPASSFNIVTRQQQPQQPASFLFQKIGDPAGPYGLNRSPPHHFLLRLKDFPPNLQDLIVVASTASTDIGLFSRSKVPLTGDKPAEKVTGVFTMTEMSDDSRRAAVPMTASLGDTSPIGLAMDLSSKEKVPKPIRGDDEIDESPFPVPALMLLNHEGVLAAWWVIYSESVRQNTVYPGLAIAGSVSQPVQPAAAQPQFAASPFGASKPASGGPIFGSPSPAPAFGSARPTTSFGTPALPGAATGAFGATSGLGKSQSPWGSASTSATPSAAFGSSAPPPAAAPAFGAPSFGATSSPLGLGNRSSVWGAGGSTAPVATFGQSSGLAKPVTAFGAASSSSASTAPASSGFAAFASKGGFATAAAGAPASGGSIFGSQAPSSNPFGSPSTGTAASNPFGSTNTGTAASNPFGSTNTGTAFGSSAPVSKPTNTFGSGGFVLNSGFKADPSSKDDNTTSSNQPQKSLFGGGFGTALENTANAPAAEVPISKEADMDAEDTPKGKENTKPSSTTPTSTPAPPKTQMFPSVKPASGGLFGTSSTDSPSTTKPVSAGFSFGQPTTEKPKPAAFSFANLNVPTTNSGPKTPSHELPKFQAPSPKTPLSPKIKQEPGTDTPAFNERIPEAPLPPNATSKASFAAGDSSASSVGNDAPLPPDFIPKLAPKPAPAPAPPSPAHRPSDAKPIPANLIPPTDVPGGPDDDGDDSGFQTEEGDEHSEDGSEEFSEEGSGEDVAKDLSPTSDTNETPEISPESSFGGLKTRSPESSVFTNIHKPSSVTQPRSLFGEVNRSAPVLLPPKSQASPRSPSPVRSAIPGRLQRPDASRSSSAPGFPSQQLGPQRNGGRLNVPSQDTFALSKAEMQADEKRREESRARKEAEEKQALVDEDDEKFQEFMASEIEPTQKLDKFTAHSDHLGSSSADSIPAQIEAVYRDINSMIDTLGLNARNLKSFVKGHTEGYKEEGRSRRDLEDDEEWCLVEMENLSSLVEKDLTRDLKDGRVQDVASKIETCNDLQKNLTRLRAKHEDLKKMIEIHNDPNYQAVTRAQPLSAEQSAQQTDLRRDYTKFQRLLSEVEEGLTVLKAKTVFQGATNGRGNGSGGPTVEAVMRTITKMTTMAEKRSGDIDVLEGQMRKLNFGSTSREGSPFATPQNNRSAFRGAASSTLSQCHSPDAFRESSHRFQNSMMSSVSSYGRGSPPRKKLSGYTTEEKAQLRDKAARKKEVTDRLRAALKRSGMQVRPMVDE